MRAWAAIILTFGALTAGSYGQGRSARSSPAPAHRTRASAVSVAKNDSPIRFEDITAKAGIHFHLTCGTSQKLYIMDSMCGGVAFLDYDRDGYADIFLVSGATLEQLRTGTAPMSRMYHNNRNGTFSDVTQAMGLRHRGWGMGVAVGDYDNDGYDDIYITYLDHAVLYRNDGGKRFIDVTEKAGVGNRGNWGTSAAFADYDNDGFLDLYVANYVDVDLTRLPEFGSGPFCQYRGIKVSCGPRGLKGGRDRLFHNRGDGTFEDVTEKLHVDEQSSYGLGVLWLDYNHDGCPDVYVADDSSPSMLYRNNCHGGFQDVGLEAGVAYSADGQEQAGMGIDAADYLHEDRQSIAKINFSDDTNNLYHNEGNGEFVDVGGPSGFGPISTPYLGFGVKFFDADNDGWPDVLVVNGHVNPQVDGHKFGVSYREKNLLFRNLGNGKFAEMAQQASPSFRTPSVGRGVAVADIDHDGKLDVLISNLDGEVLLLRNVSPQKHWLEVRLEGTHSNKDAIGARVELVAGGVKQTTEVRANSGYLSASDTAAHFGLGENQKVDLLIRWPSGLEESFEGVNADQVLLLKEGTKVVTTAR
jgi:hypothetical protein